MQNPYADVWNNLHKEYAKDYKFKYDDWLIKFDYIISQIDTEIIDLGCGVTGNNTLYLLEKGKKVISCDFAKEALKVVSQIKGSKTLLFDMQNPFPFKTNSTDLIITDLSLQYFKENVTKKIIEEIKRVLKPNGYLFFRLNSTNSTEYQNIIKEGKKEIEPKLFFTKNMEKRFFDEEDIHMFFKEFKFICLEEENMTRWCPDKIVWKGVIQNIK